MRGSNSPASVSSQATGDRLQTVESQVWVALATVLIVAVAWFASRESFLPLGLAAGVATIIAAITFPFATCLIFVLFTFYKVDDAFPILASVPLVAIFGALTFASLLWHALITRSVQAFWPFELKALIGFFMLTTWGVLLAQTKTMAFEAWLEYSKIVILTLAIMWLPSKRQHFQFAGMALIAGGLLIASVTIYNGFHGIALVELTRAVAGTGILGNPNELALILIIPLSFAAAMLTIRSGWLSTVLASVGLITVGYAIILTQSRGAVFGVVAVAFVIGGRLVRSKVLRAIAGMALAMALYNGMGIADRMSGGAADTEDPSAQNRIEAWRAGFRMALSRPVSGVGIGNFAEESLNYNSSLDRSYNAHSTWFQVLGETGWPGFFLFMLMVISCLVSSSRNLHALSSAHPTLHSAALGLRAALIGFCISASFATFAYLWPWYVLLGFTAALARLQSRKLPADTPKPDLATADRDSKPAPNSIQSDHAARA